MRRTGHVVGLLLFAFAVPAASAGPGHRLAATIAPTADIEMTGVLTVPPGTTLVEVRPLFSFWGAGLPVLTAQRAAVIVEEYRWQTVGPGPGLPYDREPASVGPTSHRQESFDAADLVLSVEDTAGSGRWLLRGDTASFRADNATCSLRPQPTGIVYVAATDVPESAFAFDPQVATLDVGCHVHKVTTEGAWSFSFDETRITVVSMSEGSPRTDRFSTGTSSSPNASIPGATDHVAGLVTVIPHPTFHSEYGGVLRLETPAEFRVSTPAVGFAGHVSVPLSGGWLEWAGSRVVDPVPSFEAEGAFVFAGQDSVTVSIRGETIGTPISAFQTGPAAPLTPASFVPTVLVVAGAGLLGTAWLLRRLLFAGLFSRLARSRVLDHPLRRRIFDAISENPGTRVHAIAKLLGVPRGTVRHHAAVLEQNSLIQSQVERRGRRFAPARVSSSAALIGGTHAPALLESLRGRPEQSQSELAQQLGISRSSVCRLIRRLGEHGLLRILGKGHGRAYEVVPA